MNQLKDNQIGEMVNELTAIGKSHGHSQALRGMLSAIVMRYLHGAISVHYLNSGFTACDIVSGVPGTWPDGHKWTPDFDLVTCPDCKKYIKEANKP